MNKEMKKVPTVRFKGFTDDWEQRKLGDVFTSLQNNTLSRADLSDEGGLALNIHYGDILIKYGEFLDVSKERIPYLTNKKTIDKFKKSHLQNGDIVVSDTAEDETVGKCTEINGVTTQIVLSGLHTIPLRPVQRFAKGYFGSYLNSEAYHAQLKPLMQGIKVTSISKRAIQDTTVIYPLDLMEQEKIGQYFLSLDHLITLHQRKLDQLQTLKKYFLQNMFPAKGEKVPAIRFKGFMGDWEEHKFEDLFVVKSGYAFKAHDYVEKGVPIVNGESIKAGYISKDNLNFLPNIFISEYPDVILNNGDIVLGLNRPVIQGRLKISRIPLELDGSLLYQRAGKILFRKKVNHDFSYQLLSEEILKFAKREAVGSDQPFITTSKLNKWRFMVPEVEEQKKIGSYLNYLDNLITLKQRKLDQLQSLKKFMLQNLFI